jgi:D-arabinose 1-dehydrogenase-like Zn-dependent alcohol dehydrogenase
VGPGFRRECIFLSLTRRWPRFREAEMEALMRAQLLTAPGHNLVAADVPPPLPGPGQVLIRVRACAVCRTDLHVIDGELPDPKLALIPGHEIVGSVVEKGADVDRFEIGDRVGVPWLGWTCGVCEYCRGGHENLCDRTRFTGYRIDGGYAELTLADQRYCFAIDQRFSDVEAAPLMCAGLIGYRTLRFAGDAERIGIYGFGARLCGNGLTLSRRSRDTRAGGSSPLPARVTRRRRISRAASVQIGPAGRTRRRPKSSTRR